MDENRSRRIALYVLLMLDLIVFVVLTLVEVLIGLLWLVFSVLLLVLLFRFKPDLFEGLFARFRKKDSSLEAQPDFVPDHTLTDLETGKSVVIDHADFLIGRSPECALCLNRDKTVSRQHARIVFRPYSKEYYLQDMRSLAGTFLGTSKLTPDVQEKLPDRSVITIGSYRLRFDKR